MQFTLKLLSRSDLTFFATQLRLQNSGRSCAAPHSHRARASLT